MKSLAVASRSFSKHQILRNEVLKAYPDAKFNDEGLSLGGDALVDFLSGYEKAILALETIDESILARLPDLCVIGKYGVGLDMLDLRSMEKYGVNLGWTGGVNKRSVSELTLSLAIDLLHRSTFASCEVRRGEWYQVRGRQLTGKTFGIIGCGHVGKDLVRLLQPFGCKILVNDIMAFHDFYQDHNISAVGLDELLARSDIVSLHVPMNESTKNLISAERLKLLKNDAILINIARGGLIDEVALEKALLGNKLGGVALDVLAVEPPESCTIAHLDNVIVTPHIGGSTEEAVYAMGMAAIEGLKNYCPAKYYLDA